MIRTSQSHPLRVDSLPVGEGLLGLTICPGKSGESVFGASWARDLEIDVAAIREWGADHVVTLTETDEMAALGVDGLGEAVERYGMVWSHVPIPDLGAPDERELTAWAAISPKLHQTLDKGGKVLIHCRGRLGRRSRFENNQ